MSVHLIGGVESLFAGRGAVLLADMGYVLLKTSPDLAQQLHQIIKLKTKYISRPDRELGLHCVVKASIVLKSLNCHT